MAWSIISEQWNINEGDCSRKLKDDVEKHHDTPNLIRDNENGELYGPQLLYLANSVVSGAKGHFYINADVIGQHYHRLRKRFRINDALRLAEVYNHSTKGPPNFGKKMNQNYRQGNTGNKANESNSSGQACSEEEPKPPEGDIYINIWEEFRYGSAILNRKSKTPMSHGGCEWARPIFCDLFSESIVDSVLCVLFFILYFVSCLLYNNFLELGWLLLYDLHLRIHENADKCNLKVKFKGSAFQGPMYCLIRVLCHHCEHDETDKIVLRLMKKMKKDITDSAVNSKKSKRHY